MNYPATAPGFLCPSLKLSRPAPIVFHHNLTRIFQMKGLSLLVPILAITLAGCATKQYPQAPEVTTEESASLDCKALDQEIAKTHSVQNQISKTGEFDGRTVMGFIGDFGLGNGLAKSAANDRANTRLEQLQNLKAARNCQSK